MSFAIGLAFSLLTAVVVILGDTFIKFAADAGRFQSWAMAAGLALYLCSAVCWYAAMRHVTLSQGAVAYSMLTLVALCLIGATVFGEPLGGREIAGVSSALLAMALLAGEA